MSGTTRPLGEDELRLIIRKYATRQPDLADWLTEAVLRPNLCEKIAELVGSDRRNDQALAWILRSALLKCLCPPDSALGVWDHKKRQALVLAVGEAFDGSEYTPFIAKMEQLWGWGRKWADPPVRPPVAFPVDIEDHRGAMTLGTATIKPKKKLAETAAPAT